MVRLQYFRKTALISIYTDDYNEISLARDRVPNFIRPGLLAEAGL